MTVATDNRRESPRSKRGAILAVAIEKFGRTGYEHTKWASIADEVGLGQTALYHYFESKAHCLLTIMCLELADSVARFETATEGIEDPTEALRAAVGGALAATPSEALRRRILQNHLDLLAAERPSEKEEAERLRSRELVQKIESRWTALMVRGVEAGVFVDDDPRTLGKLVLGMIVSVWRWYRPDGPLTLDQITETVREAAVRVAAR
ncbi:TetR/AcrR family transcriptional regulator [Nocardia farcinica]|uniref:TetR/AcrR family transcriptional regulator n=1 Tax=Nocardia farcinica TaxID=37329 RepID=UPI0018958418|nr:TetR/AcrR family transcriptional regulator [Nocardia farcinica]MBF6267663.1 TetR family transcriptional regulator [Nocardia farcinica]